VIKLRSENFEAMADEIDELKSIVQMLLRKVKRLESDVEFLETSTDPDREYEPMSIEDD
jgi:hypothetical protein